MTGATVEARGLTKHYGAVKALEDLTLQAFEGEVLGFLGPNGAGKTTTIRLLLGLARPTAGTATVLGAPAGAAGVAARRDIGYLPGELALWPVLTGRQTLAFLADLTGRPPQDQETLLEQVGLGGAELDRPVRTYSDGMKQKIGIVQALQCRPRVAFLDEPTKGLDPLVQQAFYAILNAARRRGATVLLSSHVLPEVQVVCDRVAILRAGRLVSVGAVGELRRAQRRRVRAIFLKPTDTSALVTAGHVVRSTPTELELLVLQESLAGVVARLGAMPLADIVIEPPSLEDAFLDFYR